MCHVYCRHFQPTGRVVPRNGRRKEGREEEEGSDNGISREEVDWATAILKSNNATGEDEKEHEALRIGEKG